MFVAGLCVHQSKLVCDSRLHMAEDACSSLTFCRTDLQCAVTEAHALPMVQLKHILEAQPCQDLGCGWGAHHGHVLREALKCRLVCMIRQPLQSDIFWLNIQYQLRRWSCDRKT